MRAILLGFLLASPCYAQSNQDVLDSILGPSRVTPQSVSPPPPARTFLDCDIPKSLHCRNYKGGSCVHASTEQVLRALGHDDRADWWRKTYAYGENSRRLVRRLEKSGLPYDYTKGDVRWLEQCIANGQPCGIFYYSSHAVTLIHLDSKKAGILDNNRTGKVRWVKRPEFDRRWKGYGGFGWTITDRTMPPRIRWQ